MARFKDLWFAEFERELSALEEEGIPPEHAYQLAGRRAASLAMEKLIDRADRDRKIAKGE